MGATIITVPSSIKQIISKLPQSKRVKAKNIVECAFLQQLDAERSDSFDYEENRAFQSSWRVAECALKSLIN